MNKNRLLKLAELLEADANNEQGLKFDMSTWGESYHSSTLDVSCGTNACAMGLAVLSGAFKDAGLDRVGRAGCIMLIPMMRGSGETGMRAAAELFEIEYSEAEYLFNQDFYPPDKLEGAIAERYVAARIRDFVEEGISD